MMKYGITSLTTDRVHVGTQPAVSLHRRNVAEGGIRMIEICVMSYAVEMHTTRLTTGVRNVSVVSKNDMMRGTMTIMVPSMTNSTLLMEGTTQEDSKLFPMI
jgi:hypothetical protein